MKIFAVSHDGAHLTGHSVVIAKDKVEARQILADQHDEIFRNPVFTELDAKKPGVHVLFDGNI